MLKRLLLTGAAGTIGRNLRERLAPLAEVVRVSDLSDLGGARANEEVVTCDLGDPGAVMRLVDGCDGVVHLGGIALEDRFSRILHANIQGTYNLYEAARAHGQPRIVYASTNHVVGFYRQDERIGADAPLRPDSWYAVSKGFGEMAASFYHAKFKQETAIVRIGDCHDEPKTHRQLAIWFSYDDFARLIERVFAVPRLGCPVIYGTSANAASWWDNSANGYLGWTPVDSSERFRAGIEAKVTPPDAGRPEAIYQGGPFTTEPVHPDDGATTEETNLRSGR